MWRTPLAEEIRSTPREEHNTTQGDTKMFEYEMHQARANDLHRKAAAERRSAQAARRARSERRFALAGRRAAGERRHWAKAA